MPELKIYNNKDIKELLKLIENQWGAKIKLDYGFLQNTKNRILIINKDIGSIDLSKLRINNVGLYFCEYDGRNLRLSIEGSQIIGPHATKNVVELSDVEAKEWLRGEDIQKQCDGCNGFVLIKNKNDFFGTGKYSNGKILNFVSKSRRILTKNSP